MASIDPQPAAMQHLQHRRRTVARRWTPRVLALVFTAFLSLFALDACEGVEGVGQRALALAMHLLPSGICLAVVGLAWRRPWVGAACFGLLAGAYAARAWSHPSWVLVISLPLALVALAYFVDSRVGLRDSGA